MKLDPRLAVLAIGIAIVAVFVAWPSCARRTWHGVTGSEDTDAADSEGSVDGGGIGRREVMAAAVGIVRAEIVDESGTPLSGGTVVLRCLGDAGNVRSIEGGVVELDEEGLVEGPGCRGEVCVELRHAGYVPAEPWILEPDDPKVLHARALGRLEGEVVDSSGNAVVAATVVATAVPGEDPIGVLPFTNGATTSDEDGTFSLAWIDRPPCDPCRERTGDCDGDDRPLPVLDRVQLSARAEGHGPAETIVELDEVGDAPVRIELPPAAAPIRGTLSDPEGAGYPRAFVLARSVDRPAEQHRADVDADGGFAVTGLGDGTYDLRAIQDGVALARESGVAAGEEVALVGPAQRDLVVEVVDDEGRVVPQAEVRGPPFGTARTDAQGRVQAAGVAAGAYTLRIRPRRQPVGVHTIEVARGADLPDAPQITRIRAPRTSER